MAKSAAEKNRATRHLPEDDAEALIALAENVFADTARAAIAENDRLSLASYGGLKGRVVVRSPARTDARRNKAG